MDPLLPCAELSLLHPLLLVRVEVQSLQGCVGTVPLW